MKRNKAPKLGEILEFKNPEHGESIIREAGKTDWFRWEEGEYISDNGLGMGGGN